MNLSDYYTEGYFERAEGSNYRRYGDESGWDPILSVLDRWRPSGKPGNLLEVACAKGFFVAHALMWGWNAKGFDVSEYAVRAAPPMVRGRVFVMDATEPWRVEDGVCDVVCGWEFFEHVPEEQVRFVRDEMLRVLTPGGLLVLKIGMPVPPDSPWYEGPDRDATHITMHDREWWEAILYGETGITPNRRIERQLDAKFADRDWQGRFFAMVKP